MPAPAEENGDWLETVLAMPVERSWFEVAGARVELLSWGECGAPGILFAHGFAANADWWRAIAGALSKGYRVAALSFSGMGQSDWRESYDLDLFAAELDEAAKAARLDEGPVAPLLVAHSFGGFPAIVSAARSPERWRALLLVDSRANDSLAHMTGSEERVQPRISADREKLIARFRLMPDQPCRTPRLLAEVTQFAVRQMTGDDGDEGWSWATDPNLFPAFADYSMTELVANMACPMAYIHGEESYIARDGMLPGIRANFPAGTPVMAIPNAGHHVILDQPVAVISAIRLLDEGWKPDP
ncbi:MAG: alpha/beta hydrolase [Novosphingobium sp.]|nr:alpha/beta hydrolase [Novosphingobium sp.]